VRTSFILSIYIKLSWFAIPDDISDETMTKAKAAAEAQAAEAKAAAEDRDR
jgi:hypothetical protein